MRFVTCYAVLVLALLPLAGRSEPNPADTCLLSQPAVSKHHIAFIYAEDLWIADLDGRNPRRLTSDLGLESNPVFSPDGQTLAFSAQYDGNTDVYAISITGGMPKRLTWHPGPDIVRGFTPDGKVLFNSPRHVFSNRHMQLFTVSLAGGMPEQLLIPHGFEASFSPDAAYIAYCPQRDVTSQWKHYRGGTHSRIWIYNRQNHAVVEIAQPEGRCNDLDPVWIDGTIFFRSDRNGEYNVFAYDVSSKKIRQITYYTDFPVLDLAGGGGKLVYEQAGYLHRLDPATGQSNRIKVGIAIDLVEARPRYAKDAQYIRGAGVSPKGARAVFEFRGEIVTVPAEKGDPRNLTNTTAVYERSPAWSPDGKTIGYFSDASGEYELFLAPQNGKGAVKKLHLNGAGFYRNLTWSPDSKKVLFSDNSQTLYCLDIASGKQTKIDEARYGQLSGGNKTCCWSHDSKWVAYAKDSAAKISQVYVYSLEQGKSFAITDGLTEATDPVFDASGKYLYFISSNDTGMSKHGFMQSAADSQRPRYSLNLVVLRKDLPSPFLRESDEETSEPEKKGGSDAKPPAGADDTDKVPGKPKKEPKDKKAKEPLKIDLAGIDQRILALPLPSGSYFSLQTGQPDQLYYVARTRTGDGPGGFTVALQRYDVQKRKNEIIRTRVSSYLLTPDGKKMLYSSGGSWMIGSTAPSPSGPGGKTVKVNAIEVRVEPTEEWKQIFHEAWRINRDFFYAPNMHGADWQAIHKKYEPFLTQLTSNADLYRVIRWMLSELAVGHSYQAPGERIHQRKTVPGGLLGADFEIANGRYRFKKIYGGLNWTPSLRSPLTAPGVNVKEGEYLLAVRGIDLKAPTELYSVFENTAGKSIEILVGPKPDGKDSRMVTVEPLANEYALRNRDWVEGNMKKVHQATNGRVAYVYVPDTAMGGLMSFKRYFFPQIDKEALILDERFNSGGSIADYYIDLLRKPFLSYFAPRYGEDWLTPSAAIHGPKVMLINEGAGSGGDMLPWMFRETKLGLLIGKRTWGGLVGIGGYPMLMDGGRVTAPSFGFWSPKTGWSIENEGVAPDIEVEQWPADLIAGRDPQLEKAIAVVMEELKKNPPKKDVRPDYPIRVKK